jgi:hypothetical protein
MELARYVLDILINLVAPLIQHAQAVLKIIVVHTAVDTELVLYVDNITNVAIVADIHMAQILVVDVLHTILIIVIVQIIIK